MNRRGDKAELLALFRKLRGRIPGLVLRTSLITGLPYEAEAENITTEEIITDILNNVIVP